MSQEEVRSYSDSVTSEANKLFGTAIVYGAWSQIGKYKEGVDRFKERIMQGALDIRDNIKAWPSHKSDDMEKMLGSTEAGTLRVSDSASSLNFELDLPGTTTGENVKELVSRSDVHGVSIGFQVLEDRFYKDSSGVLCRDILKAVVRDISITDNPAYLQTSVEVRNYHPNTFDASYFQPYDAEIQDLIDMC